MEGEELQLAAQLAVIATLGFFQLGKVLLERLVVGKGSAVEAREHGILFVAAPVGPGGGKQLEGPGKARVRHVRAAAQVGEVAAGIERHRIGVDVVDDLHLEVFAHVGKLPHGVALAHARALKGQPGLGNALHFRFDGFKVVAGEGTIHKEVVVETVVDGRADGDLGRREELLDRRGHDMGGGVAHNGQAFGRIGIHRLERCAPFRQGRGKIQQSPGVARRSAGRNDGLEFFAAQGLLQNGRRRGVAGNFHGPAFHLYCHGNSLYMRLRPAGTAPDMPSRASPGLFAFVREPRRAAVTEEALQPPEQGAPAAFPAHFYKKKWGGGNLPINKYACRKAAYNDERRATGVPRRQRGNPHVVILVGTSRLELLTSSVSRKRSSHLSYAPT